VNGVQSNTATVRIAITPVNDAPEAVNDTLGGRVGLTNTYNVLGNDIDVDGVIDLAGVQIASWAPQLGPQPTPTNGNVSFTPTQTGTYTFTYRAVDKAGAVSANAATVTVNVAAAEGITVTKSLYLPGKKGGSSRWTVSGTDSVIQAQVLTIAYTNGTLNAANGGATCNGSGANPKCVVGTVLVDSLGNYLYDVIVPVGGPSDPTDTATWTSLPTSVRVFSSGPVLGGSQTSVITFR
jgi:cadherin-like protein